MISAKQLANNVISTGAKYNTAAWANVLAIGLYGLQFGTKDSARRSCRDMLVGDANDPDGGMKYSTAARQVAFGMDMAALIRAKYPQAPVMTSIQAAKTIKEATDTLALFMAGMGVKSGAEAAMWAKGDGTALTVERRATLKAAPAKAEPKPEPATAEEPAPAEAPAPAKAEEPAPAVPQAEPVDPVAAVLAVLPTLSDDLLAQLQAAINAERKARKAALPLAA